MIKAKIDFTKAIDSLIDKIESCLDDNEIWVDMAVNFLEFAKFCKEHENEVLEFIMYKNKMRDGMLEMDIKESTINQIYEGYTEDQYILTEKYKADGHDYIFDIKDLIVEK